MSVPNTSTGRIGFCFLPFDYGALKENVLYSNYHVTIRSAAVVTNLGIVCLANELNSKPLGMSAIYGLV